MCRTYWNGVSRANRALFNSTRSRSLPERRTGAFIRRHRRRVIQFNRALVRPLARDMFLSVCECKTSHSRAKVLAACADRRSLLPARVRERERERRTARGRETREERKKEADDGGGGYIERASHSPSPPFILRPREGKGKRGKGKTRVPGENAERHKMEKREIEGRRENARGRKREKTRLKLECPLECRW